MAPDPKIPAYKLHGKLKERFYPKKINYEVNHSDEI